MRKPNRWCFRAILLAIVAKAGAFPVRLPASALSASSDAVHPQQSTSLSAGTYEANNELSQVYMTTKSEPTPVLGTPFCEYHTIHVVSKTKETPTIKDSIVIHDLTPTLQQLLLQSKILHGTLTVTSLHTTTSIVINEYESRLQQDMVDYFLKLAPPDDRWSSSNSPHGDNDSFDEKDETSTSIRYLHNDIHLRPASAAEFQRCIDNGYTDIRNNLATLQAWREQEPINAHSHLLSMLVGSSSESLVIKAGKLQLGAWQSVMLVDLDALPPGKQRNIGVQLMGYT